MKKSTALLLSGAAVLSVGTPLGIFYMGTQTPEAKKAVCIEKQLAGQAGWDSSARILVNSIPDRDVWIQHKYVTNEALIWERWGTGNSTQPERDMVQDAAAKCGLPDAMVM